MTAPTRLDDEDDDLSVWRHGGPEHQVYRLSNGDIVCTGGDLAIGRPLAMPDYSGAAMITWDTSWWGRLKIRLYLWRYRRRVIKAIKGARTTPILP